MFTTLDWSVLGCYLVLVLVVGVALSRRAGRSVEDYFLSGRRLPWWLAGTSLVATTFSADTPLAVTGWTRVGGVAGNWRWWGYAVSGTLVIVLFSRLWRRLRVVTDVEFIEIRYGPGPGSLLRAFRGLFNPLVFQACTMAWTLVAGRKLLATFLGADERQELLLVVALAGAAALYAILSGLWGVVITDLIQFVVAMTGAIVLAVVAVGEVGGLPGLLASTSAEHLDLVPGASAPPGGDPFSVVVFIAVLWFASTNSDGGGVGVQRFSAARDERHSTLAALWFNVANYAIRPWPWILVALASLILLPDVPDPELAYPLMMQRLLPAGLLGLTAASLVAAFMSTIDTHLNLGSAYFVNDLWRRFIRPGRGEREYVAAGRSWSVVLMAIAVVIAVNAESVRGLFDVVTQIGAGVGSVYLARWLWWRTNAYSEIAAMVASAAVTWLLNKGPYPSLTELGVAAKLLVAVGVSIPVWLTVTMLTPPVPAETLRGFYRRARPPGWWGPARDPGDRVVGADDRVVAIVLRWLAAAALVLGMTVAGGLLLLGEIGAGLLTLAVASAAGLMLAPSVLRRPQAATGPPAEGLQGP